MIKEILNKDFMLKSSTTLKKSSNTLLSNFENTPEIQNLLAESEVEIDDLREANAQIESVIKREQERGTDKEDLAAYIPCDPIMSLIQSSLHEYCREKKPDRIKGKSNQAQKLANNEEIAVTEIGMSEDLKKFLTDETAQKLFGLYENLDIGWLTCGVAAAIRRWRGRHPFNSNPAAPYNIGNNARVVLLSDWGSGLPRAQKVSQAIETELNDPNAATRDKHVIHLGDVYYSGWAKEYEENFLPFWAVRESQKDSITSWSLNANHDMYSGGKGYYETLLHDKRFQHQQKSSFFSLKNDKWLILGLDTGYDDNLIHEEHSLYGNQDEWAYEQLSQNQDKTGILLSHHQPFSSFAKGGEKLLEKLKRPLQEDLIKAWFWGHEHRCTLYKPKEKIEFPRCIGHAGIPFYVEEDPLPDEVLYEYRNGFDHLTASWNYFGFVVLDFNDDKIEVRYIDERGDNHYSETITAKS
jgi:hypothetical protein